ncbi:hypothetical protein [Haloarcula marina]|uniref:hypothetical protein n=1 Tax=Haloarcula marina TaxID=2961574 RepID=UPI0020B889BF|nr:hypothetical protein [Halomicroarcula marina]
MSRRDAAVLVVVLAAVGAGTAFIVGVGPFASGGETAPPTSDGAESPRVETPTPGPPPFTLRIDRITQCGRTCRDVTSTLRNEQAVPATEVGVTATIYAGRGIDGSEVWSGYEWVGSLGAGEAHTATQRVALSLGQTLAVERADGWITIETTVEYDGKTLTVYRQRQVA